MALSQKEQDIKLMLASNVHLGTKNCDFQMMRYVYRRRSSGHYIINLAKTWEKLHLAARIIVAIENPQDIVVQSARPYAQRAVLKFAHYTGAKALAGRYTPGTFTNQIQKDFEEPRLLIVTDPRTDHQPIKESSYMSIPTIAFCDTDSCLPHVDVAIPANNKGKHSIGVLYWILSRMVLQMRGTVTEYQPWDVMVDLFFYREPEEAREEGRDDALGAAPAAEGYGGANGLPAPVADDSWDAAPAPAPAATGQEWAAESTPAGGNEGWEAAQAPVPDPTGPPAAAPGAYAPQDDFGAGY